MLRIGVRPQTVDGRLRQIGDPVPEAKNWPNLKSYLSVGHVYDDGEVEETPPGASDQLTARPSTPEESSRRRRR